MIIQLMDIRYLFFCRTSSSNKAGLSPIVLRITYRRERVDIFTGLHCDPNLWNSDTQRVSGNGKESARNNANLDDIAHRCRERFEKLKYSGRNFTLDEYVMKIKGKDESPETILDYMNIKIAEMEGRVGVDITFATMQKYCRCIKHVKEFLLLKYKHKDISITSVDGAMLMDFFYFLRTNKNNSHNTSVNYIKCLKTVMMPAIKNRILNNDPFYGLKISPKVVMRGYLTMEEIGVLEQLKDLHEGEEQARDIFLFACYTGMAYIDVQQFSRRHLIKESDGIYCIHKARQKTGVISIIPLLPPAQRILESYSPSGKMEDFEWYVISNQKINEHLKAIREKAGINQNLFFHLARHTFATTITLSNGIPLETVSRMLGHSDIKMTQRYAKISGYKIKEDMRRLSGIFK